MRVIRRQPIALEPMTRVVFTKEVPAPETPLISVALHHPLSTRPQLAQTFLRPVPPAHLRRQRQNKPAHPTNLSSLGHPASFSPLMGCPIDAPTTALGFLTPFPITDDSLRIVMTLRALPFESNAGTPQLQLNTTNRTLPDSGLRSRVRYCYTFRIKTGCVARAHVRQTHFLLEPSITESAPRATHTVCDYHDCTQVQRRPGSRPCAADAAANG